MPEDLSYLLSKPTEEEEQRVRKAVEQECIRAITHYLDEVASAMDANSIEALNSTSLRAMSEEMKKRLTNYDDTQPEN
jgi:hypothetical protein